MGETTETIKYNIEGALGNLNLINENIEKITKSTIDMGAASQKAFNTAEKETKTWNTELKGTEGIIERLERQVKEWEQAARKATDPRRIAQYNKDIAATHQELTRLKTVGVPAIEKINQQATLGQKIFSKLGIQIAAAFSVGLLTRFIGKSMEMYDQQVKSEAKLLTALKGRTDIQKRLIKQADDLQEKTLFENDQTVAAQARLAKVLGVNEEAITRLIPLVQDFATIQDFDLERAAELVAKAVGSSTNSLKRYGIVITGAVGSSERLESAIGALTRQVGGQAEAAVVGLGKWQQFKNRWKDNREELGKFITTMLFGKDTIISLDQKLERSVTTLDAEVKLLKTGNLSQEARRVLINKINKEYGAYLPNLLTEKSSLVEIEAAQKAVNKALGAKIIAIRYQKEINQLYENEANAVDFLALQEIQSAKDVKYESIQQKEAVDDMSKTWTGWAKNVVNTTDESEKAIKEKFDRMAKYYGATWEEIMKLIEGDEGEGGLEEELTMYELLEKEIGRLNKVYLSQIAVKSGNAIKTAQLIKAKENELKIIDALAKGYKNLTENIKAEKEAPIEIDEPIKITDKGKTNAEKEADEFWDEYIKNGKDEAKQAAEDIGDEFEVTFQMKLAKALGFKSIEAFETFREAIKDFAGEIADTIKSVTDAQLEATETYLDDLNSRIAETQQALETELQLNEQGFASNVALRQKELEDLKAKQKQAIIERNKYLQQSKAIETVLQSIDLASSVASLLKSFTKIPLVGLGLASAAIAALFALWRSSVVKTKEMTEFGKGGQIKGDSHAQGGVKVPGMGVELEGGEYVINKDVTKKNLPFLEALNSGKLQIAFNRELLKEWQSKQTFQHNINSRVALDDSKQLKETNQLLRKSLREQKVEYGEGYKIIHFNNVKRKVRI
jgi:hypothetical protein